MSYLLGSGMYKDPEFHGLWRSNNIRYAVPEPSRTVVVCVAGQDLPYVNANTSEVCLAGNLGHVGDLLSGIKPYSYCGWSMGVLSLALLAYQDESDLIYKESDCLAFGPWVKQLYADMGDGDMAFGAKMESEPFMECAQSLFIVRHGFIPKFVEFYLSLGDERSKDENDHEDNLPERKFVKIEEAFGTEKIRRLSFGVDRERPLPYDDAVWYAQRFSAEELDELRNKGML